MKPMRKDVFLGSGLPSLIMALYVAKNYPNKQVVVIERDAKLGGTNASMSYPNGEIFDYGMKVYYECGIEQIDSLVEQALPAEDFFVYSDNAKDRAGCYFNHNIQKNSLCLDLRYLNLTDRVQALGELLTSDLYIDKSHYSCCESYLIAKFGRTICEKSFFPALEGLHRKPISELDIDAASLHFGAEERVILFDEAVTEDLMKSEILRKRLAYPEQTRLPKEYSKRPGRAIYPKKLGIKHLVDRLKSQLINAGAEIILQSELEAINYIDDKIYSVTLKDVVDNRTYEYNIQNLYWNSALPLLAKKLGFNEKLNVELADKTYLAHFVFNKKTEIDDLYYIYNYDERFSSFRIVNYNGYCPSSSFDQKFRVTVEVWPHNKEFELDDIFNELVTMKVIKKDLKFYLAQRKSIKRLSAAHHCKQRFCSNLERFYCGKAIQLGAFVSSEDNIFFIPDILKHAYKVFSDHRLIK